MIIQNGAFLLFILKNKDIDMFTFGWNLYAVKICMNLKWLKKSALVFYGCKYISYFLKQTEVVVVEVGGIDQTVK